MLPFLGICVPFLITDVISLGSNYTCNYYLLVFVEAIITLDRQQSAHFWGRTCHRTDADPPSYPAQVRNKAYDTANVSGGSWATPFHLGIKSISPVAPNPLPLPLFPLFPPINLTPTQPSHSLCRFPHGAYVHRLLSVQAKKNSSLPSISSS